MIDVTGLSKDALCVHCKAELGSHAHGNLKCPHQRSAEDTVFTPLPSFTAKQLDALAKQLEEVRDFLWSHPQWCGQTAISHLLDVSDCNLGIGIAVLQNLARYLRSPRLYPEAAWRDQP